MTKTTQRRNARPPHIHRNNNSYSSLYSDTFVLVHFGHRDDERRSPRPSKEIFSMATMDRPKLPISRKPSWKPSESRLASKGLWEISPRRVFSRTSPSCSPTCNGSSSKNMVCYQLEMGTKKIEEPSEECEQAPDPPRQGAKVSAKCNNTSRKFAHVPDSLEDTGDFRNEPSHLTLFV
jgi:hypothetical protein